jgi:hypothetical protein
MSSWVKENAVIVLVILCVAGVASFWIHNSYRLAEVRAEVDKMRAVEGRKFKFGTTTDK